MATDVTQHTHSVYTLDERSEWLALPHFWTDRGDRPALQMGEGKDYLVNHKFKTWVGDASPYVRVLVNNDETAIRVERADAHDPDGAYVGSSLLRSWGLTDVLLAHGYRADDELVFEEVGDALIAPIITREPQKGY